MTIRPMSDLPHRKVEINLSGPDGNAFVLMGMAKDFAKQCGYDKANVDALIKEMQSSDYKNLIQVFDRHFGEFIDLYR